MELAFVSACDDLSLGTGRCRDIKDPCPVFDGTRWHIYGSLGSSKTETWRIFHATAPHIEGWWTIEAPAELLGVAGARIAAPGVVYDTGERVFHMFIQSDYMAVDTHVYHLASCDGQTFALIDTPLSSRPGTLEASIYDPHPGVIGGRKYLTYSGAPSVGRPDIYLAASESDSWYGPWTRQGVVLSHHEVPHHNQHDHADYEWGLEGSQVVELPDGRVLLNAVCFLPGGARGTRQRVFFAVGDNVRGPFRTLGPAIEPSPAGWDSGENGHAAAILSDEGLVLFYQARSRPDQDAQWRYGVRSFPFESLGVAHVVV